MPKAILIHGNGGATADQIWLPKVAEQLREAGCEVVNRTFPDNVEAKASVWLPFLDQLGADSDTILIGHSSGAIAAMRYAEEQPVLGLVLVGTYHTDLGDDSEKASGYFDKPWDWQAITNHIKWSIVFASTDDPYIPAEEAKFVADQLGADYHEFTDRGHFLEGDDFPELVEAVKEKL